MARMSTIAGRAEALLGTSVVATTPVAGGDRRVGGPGGGGWDVDGAVGGTVGGGTWRVLARNQEEITRRAGRGIEITVVADKEVEKAKQITGGKARVTADAFEVVRDPCGCDDGENCAAEAAGSLPDDQLLESGAYVVEQGACQAITEGRFLDTR